MGQLVVHDLEAEVQDKLQEFARSHGRSIEEEAREILRDAVLADAAGMKLGSRIARRFSGIGLDDQIEELRGQEARLPTFDE